MESLPAVGEPVGVRVAGRGRVVDGGVGAVARDEPAGVVPPPAFLRPAVGAVRHVLVEVKRTLGLRVRVGRALVEVDELAHVVGVDGRTLAVGARADEAVEDVAHVGFSVRVGMRDSLDAGPVHPLDARLALGGYPASVRKVAEMRVAVSPAVSARSIPCIQR